MPSKQVFILTAIAMIAFAGNSLLSRAAFLETTIDPASFTSLRLLSGFVMLWLISFVNHQPYKGEGSWISAFVLFLYAAGFSFAYVSLSTGMGALLLFGAVQATMIGHGIYKGERLSKQQGAGLTLALAGLIGLLLPGLSSPPLFGAILMMGAGVAWGIYSLRGRGLGNPTLVTTGNFLRSIPIALLLSVLSFKNADIDLSGFWYAIASGALTSGVGYALWYSVLPFLKATNAATIQLSVPVLAAIAGILFLGEALSFRFMFASIAILGGIALVLVKTSSSTRKNEDSN
ncbi:EamA family transporter [Photobacterium frigidiphilum]|uniref:EamA family transporter n=1 Tax=Photobacterium frigidiphilum TaxID=264736 RepID=A0A2T3JDH8_9GAMM|nr:DMT family transporter [Photobacterium frigidiphilum]PSU46945.1 EamA family transporter [Photobacterium frigidiphilum]